VAIVGLTQTLAIELRPYGVTANAIGPSGATRITESMPGAPPAVEADEIPADRWEPKDPGNSSALVAWLASDDSGLVTGQVFRSIHRIVWMHGWREAATASAGEQRWDAAALTAVVANDLLGTGVVPLRFR
jgi:NAD(P)-dependent dehydrogenase (short-subunit alcohol dehydrogenase family)